MEDPIAKEKMLKFAKNEQFKDETLGKTLINYIKAYESPELIRNRIRERDQVQKAQETGDEKLGLSVADLSKQMKLMFLNIIEGPLIDRAKGYKQMSCSLMLKIMKKIKDSEAFLYSRSLTMITVRKENGKILEKLKSIKEIIISTKEKINKSKNRKSVKNSNDSFLDLALKNPIQKIDKKNNRTPNLLTAERNSIQNFMEKAIDEQMKEEEINKLNDNKLNFEMKLIYNEQILSQMEGENQVERKNLKETQKLIRNFLFKLLENGKDCRLVYFY